MASSYPAGPAVDHRTSTPVARAVDGRTPHARGVRGQEPPTGLPIGGAHVKLGLVLPIAPEDGDAATWADIEALARLAEDGGADSLWLADHFFYRPPETPARQI